MDSGPVYLQQEVTLSGHETKPELYEQLFALGETMLTQNLHRILDGDIAPTPQDDSRASYCALLSKSGSLLQLENFSAEEAEARVRAHLGFPRTRLQLDAMQIIITRAHTSPDKTPPLSVRCLDGKYLVIDELIAPSGKTMSAEAFARGYLS